MHFPASLGRKQRLLAGVLGIGVGFGGPFLGSVGLVAATGDPTALILPPSLKSVGIYAVYLLVVFVRPRGLFGSL